ncbi:MAG TPA: helix-turn-helix transcriptional regulator, partial [Pseudonocardiaceae bacterium]|nr:helix-turn-helix transcriptional regulator [Pseudonocardiaceae bacterium]
DRARSQLSALTPREREIAELVVGAATDREIARCLGISQRTVHKHLERIYRKLSLTSRTSLITLVHRENSPTLRSAG